MKTTGTLTTERKAISVKTSLIAALLSCAAAVALPQLLHVIGAVTGLGTMPGETFLPMHLPVLLCGFFAGPLAGVLAGAASPAISAALTGMPLPAMLPFMTIELAGYGLAAGFIKYAYGTSDHMVVKVLAAQVFGRAIRAIAILTAFYGMGLKMIAPPVIWNSVIAGLPGIAAQLILIPAVVYAVGKMQESER